MNLVGKRDVAQFGRALRSGRRGRRFESCHLDQRDAGPNSFWVQRFFLCGSTATGIFFLHIYNLKALRQKATASMSPAVVFYGY